jgi:hypothetical protein
MSIKSSNESIELIEEVPEIEEETQLSQAD